MPVHKSISGTIKELTYENRFVVEVFNKFSKVIVSSSGDFNWNINYDFAKDIVKKYGTISLNDFLIRLQQYVSIVLLPEGEDNDKFVDSIFEEFEIREEIRRLKREKENG